jgi:hypothetical protein
LDAYSSYHQINMNLEDDEKIMFITPFRGYYYVKMWFRLTNVWATYQKRVHIVLEPQVRRNVKAYIDDIIVKSKQLKDLLDDLKETFNNLDTYHMMLNLKKCMFGVSTGKLLDYMVSAQGIDVNPKMVQDIEKLPPPQQGRKSRT